MRWCPKFSWFQKHLSTFSLRRPPHLLHLHFLRGVSAPSCRGIKNTWKCRSHSLTIGVRAGRTHNVSHTWKSWESRLTDMLIFYVLRLSCATLLCIELWSRRGRQMLELWVHFTHRNTGVTHTVSHNVCISALNHTNGTQLKQPRRFRRTIVGTYSQTLHNKFKNTFRWKNKTTSDVVILWPTGHTQAFQHPCLARVRPCRQ